MKKKTILSCRDMLKSGRRESSWEGLSQEDLDKGQEGTGDPHGVYCSGRAN